MRNLLIPIIAVIWLAAMPAALANTSSPAAPHIITKTIPDAQTVGSGRMQYLFWNVYDATLYAPGGKWQADQPYALNLSYLHALSGADIAERSVEEMRKQGFGDEVKLAAWFAQMRDIFPDVKPGDSLTGFYHPGKETVFYLDDQVVGTVRDPEFGTHFFNIWLSEKTSEPKLRRKLMGQHAKSK